VKGWPAARVMEGTRSLASLRCASHILPRARQQNHETLNFNCRHPQGMRHVSENKRTPAGRPRRTQPGSTVRKRNAARPRDEDYDAVRTRPTRRKKKRRLERDVENNHPAKKKANKEMIYSLGRMTSVRNSVINKPSNGFCSPRCRRGEAASPE